MARKESEHQKKSMSKLLRGKTIFKSPNTGRIDEWVACLREWGANIFFYTKNGPVRKKSGDLHAPKDIQAATQDHPARFHALSWKLAVISLLLMVAAFVYGGYDGVKHSCSFRQHRLRFAVMLYLWKAFDIVCLGWLLLTKFRFFQHFYPETKGCAGCHQFGFNRKEPFIRLAVFPFAAAGIALLAMGIGGHA